MSMSSFLVILCILISTTCSYKEDSCFANDRPGTCKLLIRCSNLLQEIRNAGSPMPTYVRKKLQALACGFDGDQPLVCCEQDSNVDTGFDYQNDEGQRGKPDTWISPVPTTKPDIWVPPRPTTKPDIWDSLGLTTPTQRPIKVDNRGDSNMVLDKPPDVSNHPNLRLLPTQCGNIESERIFGGNRTALFEMPWMVLLSYKSGRGIKLSCGGTLITERYVLTAAHCVSFLGKMQLDGAILGEYDVRKNPDCERMDGELVCAPPSRNVTIETVISHPGYNPQTLFDDIALIRLSEPADFSLDSMKPICLPTTTQLQNQKLDGLQGIVAGWGATEEGLQSPVLLSVALPILSNKECQDIYNGSPQIYDRQLCAGGVQDKDSCGGDSGGPLMYPGRTNAIGVRYVQFGIVSFGSKRCGIGGYPGVYTRVAYYMDWILDNIR